MKRSCRSLGRVTLVISLLSAASLFPVFADVTFTTSTGTGVMYGLATEIVYGAYNGQTYTLSLLDWPVQPLFYVKEFLAMSTTAGFAASLEVRLGVPARTGSGSDSDWLNYGTNGDPSRTNYYQFDCYDERAIQLDAQAGWDIPVAAWVTLEPFIAFGFADYKWSARDGFLQYPPNWFVVPPGPGPFGSYPPASTDPRQPVSGTLIIYEQTYFIPAVGLSARFRIGEHLSCAVSFAFSPLVFCNDLDNHVLSTPGNDFCDSMLGGVLLEPKISVSWQMVRSARLSLDVSYRHIAGLIGTTTQVATGVGYTPGFVVGTYPGGAGATFDALDASVNLVWTL
jgi:outer membrane protease